MSFRVAARKGKNGPTAQTACRGYPAAGAAALPLPEAFDMLTVEGRMGETLLNAVVAVGILGGSLVLTNLFVRKMYYRCRKCGTLNAKRRSQCRMCGENLP